ncbi:MAG: hypothetical protein RMJ36_02645 [Candidatus Calescibacterium sp.]|nr:hypothetical protein [Candidatus Calescibacterium sp.]MDW8132538.1 hypothetical protein [Candidatus Calescibacterium sp.]
MAHAYVPGLKVLARTIIKKERKLPIEGEVLVNKNSIVKAHDVVARAYLPGPVDIINAANKLGIDPQELSLFLIKKEGDRVNEGETIVKYSSFFGLFKQEIKSNITGVIESVSLATGQIILRRDPTPIEVLAFVDGIIEDVLPKLGVLVKTYGTYIQGIFGVGKEKIGRLKVIVNDNSGELVDDSLLKSVEKGDIVVGGSYVSKEFIDKAIEKGVSGIIVGGIDAETLKQILGYEIGVAVTGTEDIPITFVITEGFGKINMAEKTFQLLKNSEGRVVSISGATQIRAGVIRPEIIIPYLDEIQSISDIKEESISTSLDVGAYVRVIREPYFGKIAVITELIEEPYTIYTESKVRVAKIRMLDSNEEIIYPRANIEIIEEK